MLFSKRGTPESKSFDFDENQKLDDSWALELSAEHYKSQAKVLLDSFMKSTAS